MSVRIDIPESVFHLPPGDISREVLETVAVEGFRSGSLTSYQVRKLLGLSTRAEVHQFLVAHDVPWVDYSIEDLERERKELQELIGR